MWPWGEHWQRLAEGEVPEHYLPAHFWHLCAAARHPEDQAHHLAEAGACLDRSDWPELAEMLRRYMVRPTPEEILDLFTYGDEPPE